MGWQSAAFLSQERQLFGAPGGIMHDWDIKTNIEGVYAAGVQLFAADRAGYYAGRKAADYAGGAVLSEFDTAQVEDEKKRLYAPMYNTEGVTWRELNTAISKAMQNYRGGLKCDALLLEGIDLLKSCRSDIVHQLCCTNPHDLMRTHEVMDILDVCEMILNVCLLRKSCSKQLCLDRSDYPETDPERDNHLTTVRQENGEIIRGDVPVDYFGDLEAEYESGTRTISEVRTYEQNERALCFRNPVQRHAAHI